MATNPYYALSVYQTKHFTVITLTYEVETTIVPISQMQNPDAERCSELA